MSEPKDTPPLANSTPILPDETPSADPAAQTPVAPRRLGTLATLALATVLIVAGVVLVSTYFIEREIEAKISIALFKNLNLRPPGFEVAYTGVRVSLLRQSVALLDLKITTPTGKTLQIDRVRVWGIDWDTLMTIAKTRKAVIPHELKFALDGFHITPELVGAESAAMLESLGYENLAANFYAAVAFHPALQTVDINDFKFDIDKFGYISGSLHIANFTLPSPEATARLKKDPRLLLTETEEFTKVTLKGFSLTYHDNSFLKRATQTMVANGEASPEELVQLAIEVNEPVPQNPTSPPRPVTANDFTKPALITLLNFVHDPTSITLESNPPQPIALMSLLDEQSAGSINDLAHKLHLSCR